MELKFGMKYRSTITNTTNMTRNIWHPTFVGKPRTEDNEGIKFPNNEKEVVEEDNDP